MTPQNHAGNDNDAAQDNDMINNIVARDASASRRGVAPQDTPPCPDTPGRYAPPAFFSGERQAKVRPRVAVVSLLFFLASQWLMPSLFMVSQVQAKEAVKRKAEAAGVPAWYQAQVKRESARRSAMRTAPQRLAQGVKGQGSPTATAPTLLANGGDAIRKRVRASKPGDIVPSVPLYQPQPQVSLKALDLSEDKEPTADEIALAGMDCGPLAPTSEASPERLKDKLDKEVGARRMAPEKVKEKIRKLRQGNRDFAAAVQKWNEKDYRVAVAMLEGVVKDHPESPWADEARLHIADNAQYTGRFSDSILIYQDVFERTAEAQAGELAFEVHSKARMKWAGTDILLGRFSEARTKLKAMMAEDPHWRRRTWADYWLQTLDLYDANRLALHTCGSMALLVMLKELGRDKGAEHLANLNPTQEGGFSLAELTGLAKRHGVELKGFRASVGQLANLPMPLLIHCDFHASEKMTASPAACAQCVGEAKAEGAKAGKAKAGKAKNQGAARAVKVAKVASSHSHVMHAGVSHHAVMHKTGAAQPIAAAPINANSSTFAQASKAAAQASKAAAAKVGATKVGAAKIVVKPAASAVVACASCQAAHGHYFVVESIDTQHQEARLYNPQIDVWYTVPLADLAKEWTGTGLLVVRDEASANTIAQRVEEVAPLLVREEARTLVERVSPRMAKKGKTGTSAAAIAMTQRLLTQNRFAWLSQPELNSIRGGCYIQGKQSNLGRPEGPQPPPVCPKCPPSQSSGPKTSSYGSPSVEVNIVNQNVFITDTPLWHQSAVGPDVEITMSYNSLDAGNYHTPFGNKWSFNYGSHLTINTADQVTLFMPDGRQDLYTPTRPTTGGVGVPGEPGYAPPPPDGRFIREVGIFNELLGPQATQDNTYVLNFPDGSKMVYGRPGGIMTYMLIREVDRWGNAVTMGYDTQGNLTTITDAQNRVWTLTYDDARHITQVQDPWQRQASFSYDLNGNMVQAVDMEGHAFQYTYDAMVNIAALNTAQGPWTFQVKPMGVVNDADFGQKSVTIFDPMQDRSQQYYFDGRDHQGQYYHYDKKGTYTRFYVDAVINGRGLVTRIEFPDGTRKSYDYDTSNAQIVSQTSVDGIRSTIAYNARGMATQVSENGRTGGTHTTTATYAANGLDLLSATNAKGETPYSATYNAYHQVTSSSDVLHPGVASTYTYTAWGAPATATDVEGHATTYNYDTTTKLLSSISRNGATVASYTYDNIGRVRTSTDATNLTLTYDYNNLDQVTRVTYPDGTYQETDYICCGLPGVVRDRSGRKSYYDYDPLKRPIRMQDAAGNSVSYEYDVLGNLTRLVDSKGNATRWTHDNMGRVVGKILRDGTSESCSYSQGLPTSWRNARNQTTSLEYDGFSNVSKIDYPNMADVSLSYDALDRVTQMTDGLGTHTFAYNILGEVTGVDGPANDDALTYAYDVEGRRSSMQLQGSIAVSYGYDALDRLSSLTSGAGVFEYSYAGNTDMLQQVSLPNGAKSEYSYDSLQRLTGVNNRTSTNANISQYGYNYNTRDVRTSMDAQVGTNPLRHVNYNYDVVDQLTSEASTEATPKLNTSYAYDAMGNRTASTRSGLDDSATQISYTPNRLNQIASSTRIDNGVSSTSALSYDQSGNLTGETYGSGGSTYTYDDADRLTSIVRKTSAGVNDLKSEFVYDGMSRKVLSYEYSWDATTSAWLKMSDVRRIYDGMDVIREVDGTRVVDAQGVATWSYKTINYTRDGNIGGLLAKTDAGTSSSLFYHYDGSGNVTQLTDSQQNTVAAYEYDAYGRTLDFSGAQASSNPYRYQTKEQHQASGLYDFGYRFYSPGMGRWINRDPIAENGGLNLYSAFLNDPINLWDEYGLDAGDGFNQQIQKCERAIQNIMKDIRDHYKELRMDPKRLKQRAPVPGEANKDSLQWHKDRILDEKKHLQAQRNKLARLRAGQAAEIQRKEAAMAENLRKLGGIARGASKISIILWILDVTAQPAGAGSTMPPRRYRPSPLPRPRPRLGPQDEGDGD